MPNAYRSGIGGGGGGGGGDTRSLISAWRSKIIGNLYPGGASTAYPDDYGDYEPYEPETPKMKGFAKGMDPDQAMGLYYRPSMMLPKVAKGLPGSSPDYADIAALPMAQLTTMMAGNKMSAPKVDLYGNLTAKDTSLSDYTNSLAKMYSDVVNREEWFDYDQMAGNMMTANKKSALGAQFAKQPAATQASNFVSNAGALFSTTVDPKVASAWTAYAGYLADKFGSKHLGSKPGGNLARSAGKKLFYE